MENFSYLIQWQLLPIFSLITRCRKTNEVFLFHLHLKQGTPDVTGFGSQRFYSPKTLKNSRITSSTWISSSKKIKWASPVLSYNIASEINFIIRNNVELKNFTNRSNHAKNSALSNAEKWTISTKCQNFMSLNQMWGTCKKYHVHVFFELAVYGTQFLNL